MASPHHLFRHLRSALPGADADRTDGQLLTAYLADGEEAAFAALLRRHGPMVWRLLALSSCAATWKGYRARKRPGSSACRKARSPVGWPAPASGGGCEALFPSL